MRPSLPPRPSTDLSALFAFCPLDHLRPLSAEALADMREGKGALLVEA